MDPLQVVTQALAQARPPSKPWTSCPRVRVRCSADQVDDFVEAARTLGLTGPSGTYLDPVGTFWVQKDMILWDDKGGQLKRITFTFSKEHQGEPVIEADPEPRLMTALRNDVAAMDEGKAEA